MSQAGDGVRRPGGPKSAALEAILALARRSPRHSSLFWFLFDQHDQLIEAKKETGLGIAWESMLPRFAALNLTLCKGKTITLRGVRQTFLRVQKKKARLAALEAKAEAERAFQNARDPRRNMPSRFTGSFPAPLSDRQPPRVDRRALPLPPPPAPATEVGSGLTVMPGGPVLTGGPEERLPAAEFTIIFEGEPLDLRLFIHPKDDPRPWDLAEFNEEQRIRVMKKHLKMRFESWRTERGGSRNNRIDREWRKRLGKS
jgi:hypothetical protein